MKKIKDWDWESIICMTILIIPFLLLIFYFYALIKCSNDPNAKVCSLTPELTQPSKTTQSSQDNSDNGGIDFKCVYIFGSGFKCGFMID